MSALKPFYSSHPNAKNVRHRFSHSPRLLFISPFSNLFFRRDFPNPFSNDYLSSSSTLSNKLFSHSSFRCSAYGSPKSKEYLSVDLETPARDIRITFGPYEGKFLGQLEPNYLVWMSSVFRKSPLSEKSTDETSIWMKRAQEVLDDPVYKAGCQDRSEYFEYENQTSVKKLSFEEFSNLKGWNPDYREWVGVDMDFLGTSFSKSIPRVRFDTNQSSFRKNKVKILQRSNTDDKMTTSSYENGLVESFSEWDRRQTRRDRRKVDFKSKKQNVKEKEAMDEASKPSFKFVGRDNLIELARKYEVENQKKLELKKSMDDAAKMQQKNEVNKELLLQSILQPNESEKKIQTNSKYGLMSRDELMSEVKRNRRSQKKMENASSSSLSPPSSPSSLSSSLSPSSSSSSRNSKSSMEALKKEKEKKVKPTLEKLIKSRSKSLDVNENHST